MSSEAETSLTIVLRPCYKTAGIVTIHARRLRIVRDSSTSLGMTGKTVAQFLPAAWKCQADSDGNISLFGLLTFRA
jgi:hypothetical protein